MVFVVYGSNISMNNGNLHLNRKSILSFHDYSSFHTYNNSNIIGHTPGLWDRIIEQEEDHNQTTPFTLNSSFNWFCLSKGDRIEFYSSIVRMNNKLTISSGSDLLWDGIYLYDSFFNDFIEEQECDYNIIYLVFK